MMRMIVLLAALASQYSPGIMEEVVANRQAGITWLDLPKVLPEVDGYVAVADCDDIGQVMWLRGPGQQWERFLAVDCAKPDDSDGALSWMRDRNILVEVDYKTAERWGVVGELVRVELGVPSPRLER